MCADCYDDDFYEDEDDTVDFDGIICGTLENEHGTIRLDYRGESWPGQDQAAVHLSDFHVDEEHRRQGYGRQLLETVIEKVSERGFDLTLDVYADNTPAVRLYESLGFVVTKETTYILNRVRLDKNDVLHYYKAPETIYAMRRPCRVLVAV